MYLFVELEKLVNINGYKKNEAINSVSVNIANLAAKIISDSDAIIKTGCDRGDLLPAFMRVIGEVFRKPNEPSTYPFSIINYIAKEVEKAIGQVDVTYADISAFIEKLQRLATEYKVQIHIHSCYLDLPKPAINLFGSSS